MKYLLLTLTTILSFSALAQNKNMVIKDVKTLEKLFNDKNNYTELNYRKYIHNIDIVGYIDKTPFITKTSGKHEGDEWVIILDGVEIYLGKKNINKFNLTKFYKHLVQIKGSLLYGSIDIYNEENHYAQSRTGYRIDVESIEPSNIKENLNTVITNLKTLELIFADTNQYKNATTCKYIKDVIIEGFVDKIGLTNQSIQAKKSRWVLILTDSTEVWIETKFNLNTLYKKRVQMTGDLIDKTNMHLVKSLFPEPPQEEKYRFIAMHITLVK